MRGLHSLIIIAQALALSDVTDTRWQQSYPGHFGFFTVEGGGDACLQQRDVLRRTFVSLKIHL